MHLLTRLMTVFLMLAVSLGCTEQASSEESGLLTPPDKAELESGVNTLKSVFEEEYKRAESGSAGNKSAFARKLYKAAGETEPTSDGYFPMLYESIQFAKEGLNCELAFDATDMLQSQYDVSGPGIKLMILKAFADDSVAVREVKEATPFVIPAIQEAANKSELETALSLQNVGNQIASRVFSKSLQRDLAQSKETIDLLKAQQNEYKAALATLDRSGSDAVANLTVAQYLGLRLGQWEDAEAYANKVKEDDIRSLFVREVLKPEDAADVLALADDWWDFSETLTGAAKLQCRDVAIGHYQAVVNKLSGFEEKKAETRIAEKVEMLVDVRVSSKGETSSRPIAPTEGLSFFLPFDADGTVKGNFVDRHGVEDASFSFRKNGGGLEIPNNERFNLNTQEEFCISFWAKKDGVSEFTFLLNKGGPGGALKWTLCLGEYETGVTGYEGKPYLGFHWSPHVNPKIPVWVVSDGFDWNNDWHQYQIVCSKGNFVFFMDGQKIGTAKNSTPLPANSYPFRIGQSGDREPVFNGCIDEIRIYNRALSLEEVKVIYEAEKP